MYFIILCVMQEEEDVEDPQDQLKEKCSEMPKCAKLQEVLETCNDRVNSKTNTTETCTEELFDFVHCVEHCVSIQQLMCSEMFAPLYF